MCSLLNKLLVFAARSPAGLLEELGLGPDSLLALAARDLVSTNSIRLLVNVIDYMIIMA